MYSIETEGSQKTAELERHEICHECGKNEATNIQELAFFYWITLPG